MDTMYASHHFTPHGRYELNKLTSLPMCGFIVQLVEHCAGIRRSRVRIALKPWFFQASSLQLLKLENLPRWSFFAFKMATLSLFWDVIMVAVTACGNAIRLFDWATVIYWHYSYLASSFCNKARGENFPEEYQDMLWFLVSTYIVKAFCLFWARLFHRYLVIS